MFHSYRTKNKHCSGAWTKSIYPGAYGVICTLNYVQDQVHLQGLNLPSLLPLLLLSFALALHLYRRF